VIDINIDKLIMRQNRESRKEPMHLWSIDFLIKVPRAHHGKKTVFSISGIGKPGFSHAKQ
jgi:hypothetical protein